MVLQAGLQREAESLGRLPRGKPTQHLASAVCRTPWHCEFSCLMSYGEIRLVWSPPPLKGLFVIICTYFECCTLIFEITCLGCSLLEAVPSEGLSGCLGIEAPKVLKADSVCPPQGGKVSHYQSISPGTVARCAHPSLGGAKPTCGGHISGMEAHWRGHIH